LFVIVNVSGIDVLFTGRAAKVIEFVDSVAVGPVPVPVPLNVYTAALTPSTGSCRIRYPVTAPAVVGLKDTHGPA
jgi:hypothetical protein